MIKLLSGTGLILIALWTPFIAFHLLPIDPVRNEWWNFPWAITVVALTALQFIAGLAVLIDI